MKELEQKIAHIKESFSEFGIKNEDDVRTFINVSNILEAAYGDADPEIIKNAIKKSRSFEKLNSINDYYYLTFSSIIECKEIKKVAYPMFMGALTDVDEEADLDKWSGLVYKVYDAVSSGEMSFENALDYYSGYLDKKSEEDKKFKKWVRYYKDGEHLKYNARSEKMKKEAFQFPLNSSGFYPDGTKPAPENSKFQKMKEDKERKQEYVEWKKKLYAAIRRIDKLLRHSEDYLDSDIQAELADLLHSFDMEVRRVQMKSTASDLAFKTADAFNKRGFKQGHDELISFAQEAPEEVAPPIEDESPPGLEEEPAEAPNSGAKGSAGAIADSIEGDKSSEPGPKPGEYAELAGDVSLGTAAGKLEDIAARLADRRTIRLLAEFDIMLDKIGIASMFPELAEAQSKLIDAYSYALVRVTKMLGMIASGKSLAEISDAKKNEVVNKTMKEVDKAFQSPEAEAPKGTEAIKEEFQGEAPEGGRPQQAPEQAPEEEV